MRAQFMRVSERLTLYHSVRSDRAFIRDRVGDFNEGWGSPWVREAERPWDDKTCLTGQPGLSVVPLTAVHGGPP